MSHVNEQLIAMARENLGPDAMRILVTGGTGFVGSHLARVLSAAGHEVTIIGRNRYRNPIGPFPVRFVRTEVTDRPRLDELCRDCDFVYHAAALSSPWGAWEHFQSANVLGTQNVADACRQQNVARLVHVSSTAIFFQFQDRMDIGDTDPLPKRFCCHYARSKADAEGVIRKAVASGLNAITIRARAIFGPGDNSLLPRLIRAAQRGRLRQIGDGTNRLDMTFVDNLVAALLLAARHGEAGSVCTITNGEPVALWPLLNEILPEFGVTKPLRRVPYRVAVAAAGLLEAGHHLLRPTDEPAMTRYSVGLLAKNQTFDQQAAERVLGYKPIVSMKEGVRETIDRMTNTEEVDAQQSVTVRLFSTGYTAHRAGIAERGASWKTLMRFHAAFALLDHPTEGLSLFDTGYAPRFFDASAKWPYLIYRQTTPVETCAELSVVSILKRIGVDPGEIRRIIISHFHADHVCGLIDFPNAELIATSRAWHAIRNSRGMAAVRRATLPDLFPPDLDRRLQLIDTFHSPGFGPIQATHDLFGDGSLRLVDLTGHATGQAGLLVQRLTDRCLLAADAAWTTKIIRQNLAPTPAFRFLAASTKEVQATQKMLHAFHRQFPAIEIIPTHCPEVASRYGFDADVDRLLSTRESAEATSSHKVVP